MENTPLKVFSSSDQHPASLSNLSTELAGMTSRGPLSAPCRPVAHTPLPPSRSAPLPPALSARLPLCLPGRAVHGSTRCGMLPINPPSEPDAPPQTHDEEEHSQAALDLSAPSEDYTPTEPRSGGDGTPTPGVSSAGRKRSRKGNPSRLGEGAKITRSEERDEATTSGVSQHKENPSISRPDKAARPSPITSPPDARENGQAKRNLHECISCGLIFRDLVMYTMHMGYHDYANPFKCNMCGYEADDRLSFFVHIIRSSHP